MPWSGLVVVAFVVAMLGASAYAAYALVAPPAAARAASPRHPVRVVRVLPHDPTSFTQGLVFHDGKLYESTGQVGASRLREVDLESGRATREIALEGQQFGEGLALAGERLVQLTWLDGIAHVWRLEDFAPLGTYRYRGEGWGLAFDGRRFVQSDGSAKLTFRDAETFEPTGSVTVRRDGVDLAYLNELEWVAGRVYANVWISEEVVAIDPEDGRVVATYDARGLLAPDEATRVDVMNGIAHDPASGHFFLTGKYWPRLFEVELPAP